LGRSKAWRRSSKFDPGFRHELEHSDSLRDLLAKEQSAHAELDQLVRRVAAGPGAQGVAVWRLDVLQADRKFLGVACAGRPLYTR